MEYADDGDLYQQINEHQRLGTRFSENDVWCFLIQIARGLQTLHRLNIFHRDLKVFSA